jgi:tripartite-type tricarboxylate transporter receptor subunit TctC
VAEVRFVVPFGAEGAADRAARAFAGSLSFPQTLSFPPPINSLEGRLRRESSLGSRFRGNDMSIENLPGAGGLAGVRRANALARSGAPTLLLGTPTTHILLPARLGAGEAPDASLQPLLGLGSAPNVLLVSPALGVGSLAQLIDRARRTRLTYASAGTGQTIHLCTALLCRQAGITMAHRPYDGGSATAYEDLIRGDVHVYFDSLLGCRERIAAGDAIPLAVSAATPSALLPEVPTLVESGFPEHSLEVWLGVFGANLASEAADAIASLAGDISLAAHLRALGLRDGPSAAAGLVSLMDESADGWRKALAG